MAETCKCDDRCGPSSQTPQHPTLYRRLKQSLGRSLKPKFHKGSVVRRGQKATHKCSRSEGGLTDPSELQCQNQTVLVAMDNSTVVAYINKQGRTHSEETHSRMSKCDGPPSVQVKPCSIKKMVTTPSGVQTDLSEVVHPSCRSICHISEPQTYTVCVSNPRPKCLGHRCSEHKLDRSHCLCLLSYSSHSKGDKKNQAMPLPNHSNIPRLARDALVLGPSTALNRDPTANPGVNNSSQTVPQLCVPQQSATSQPQRLLSRCGQLRE